jgi:hypothetical protein
MTPVYRSQGNAKHYATPAYRNFSAEHAALVATPKPVLIYRALAPAAAILAFIGVPVVLAIVGFGL